MAAASHSKLGIPKRHRVLIESGGHLKVILANPGFVEAHGISAAYRDPQRVDRKGMHRDFTAKYEETRLGLEQLVALAEGKPGTIDVKLAHYGLAATFLVTDDAVFFEPYYRNPRTERSLKLLDTFELRLEGPAARELFEQTFSIHWEHADDLDNAAVQEQYVRLLSGLRRIWGEKIG